MISTCVILKLMMATPDIQKSSTIVYLGLSSPSPEFLSEVGKFNINEETCEKLKLEHEVVGSDIFVWGRDVYDPRSTNQRLELWEKLSNGKVGPNDVVILSDYFGALSNVHNYLDDQFGVNEENSQSVKAIVGNLKTLTIEATDGSRKTFNIPQSDNLDMTKLEAITPFKPLDPNRQNVMPPKVSGLEGQARLQYFGYWRDPLEKFAAGERMLKHLYNLQKGEREKLDMHVLNWKNRMIEAQSNGAPLPTQLSPSDKSYLDQMMQMEQDRGKWEPFKVVSAEITPSLSLRFFKAKTPDGYVTVSPVLLIDRPVTLPNKPIKP